MQSEDYAAAAQLRDRIAQLESQDPLLAAQVELEAAVREERFEVGCRYWVRLLSLVSSAHYEREGCEAETAFQDGRLI